ncbi:unnamed protein product [Clavelina lepadiformis]|uniref:Major facilitator superfamily (MFS) profile domain-containing protein n=2 Tax=Clavelina lepadiformis TaxID=159417 RepID=A0ABP0FXG6_CLALP
MLMKYKDPPDGGWGWAVTFTSFLTYAIAWAVARGISVLFTNLQETFQSTISATSWITSLITGFLACGTLLGSAITGMAGQRVTMMTGGVLSCIGTILISQAPNISVAYVGSILTGIGFGFAYCSGSSQIGVYFNRKRSLAYGIAALGAPANGMLFPPMLLYLTQEYTWRGAILITAGICLNLMVAGSLLRPVEITSDSKQCIGDEDHISISLNKEIVSNICNSPILTQKEKKNRVEKIIDENILDSLKYPVVDTTQFLKVMSASTTQIHQDETLSVCSNEKLVTLSLPQLPTFHKPYQNPNCTCSPLAKQIMLHETNEKLLAQLLVPDAKIEENSALQTLSNKEIEVMDSELRTSNIFLSTKIETPEKHFDRTLKINYLTRIYTFFYPYITLLKQWRFMLFVLTGSLDYFVRLVPTSFIVVHAQKLGLGQVKGAYLLVIFAVFDSIIRPITGLATSRLSQRWLRKGVEIILFGGAEFVMGLVNILAPSATGFLTLAMYMGVYGITNGLNSSWCFPILTRLVPIDHLHHAIGLFHFFCGIGLLTGPPLTGYLADVSGNYNIVFYFSGAVLLLSCGTACILFYLTQKYGIRKVDIIFQKNK